jgi:hypothetical protein
VEAGLGVVVERQPRQDWIRPDTLGWAQTRHSPTPSALDAWAGPRVRAEAAVEAALGRLDGAQPQLGWIWDRGRTEKGSGTGLRQRSASKMPGRSPTVSSGAQALARSRVAGRSGVAGHSGGIGGA